MNARPSSCLRGLMSFVAPLALVLSVMVSPALLAQSSDASSGAVRLGTVRAPFVVAPSYGLSYAPNSVASVDVNHDGKLDLITADVATGNVTVQLGNGSGTFTAGTAFACGCHPSAIAAADMGDGQASVVLGDAVDGTVRVLSVSSNGTLALKASYATGIAPALLVTGSFGGDGGADVAVVGGRVSTLAVLLNDGRGNLGNPITTALHKTPASIATGSFIGDGHADLAIGNADGTVSVLAGKGNGGFQALADVSAGTGVLSAVAVGDFDHDGKMDLAVTGASSNAVSVLLGKGDGSFVAAHSYAVGNGPASVLVADVNGDGNADLVAVNQASNTFSVLTGNGDGTFRESADFVVGNGPAAGVIGDFDGDGRTDLAVIDSGSQAISVALGNGDGSFQAGRAYGAELMPVAAAAGDLNHDGRTDLVVANYCGSDEGCAKGGSVSVFLADVNGVYKLAHSYAVGSGPVTAALMDVDGDGILDIVALNRVDKTITLLSGKGDGSFEAGSTLSLSESPVAAVVGDFNGDGKPDLAVVGDCGAKSCTQPGSVEVLLGQAGGGFRSSAVYSVGYEPAAIAAGDLNGDKMTDLVVANRCGADVSCKSAGTATVLMASAGGGFKAAGASTGAVGVGSSPAGIALGDLAGRGVLDMVVSRSGDNTVAALRGNGDGTFGAATSYAVGNGPGAIAVGDFDGDGKLDVAVANTTDSTVSVLFGTGSGKMGSASVMPVGSGPAALTAIAGSSGKATALVTANANGAAAQPGTEITVLTRLQPEVGMTAPASIAVTLTNGSTPATFGAALQFTATVTGTDGATQPTGTVTFDDGSAPLTCTGSGDGTLTQNGTTNSTATCSISTLSVGTHHINGTYNAGSDPTYTDLGPSNSITQVIYKATPMIALARTTGTASVGYGTTLTFTATVTGATGVTQPTGSVTFKDGSTTLSCSGANDNTLTQGTTSSTATCTIATLAVGTSHSITANYAPSGDPNYNAAGPTSGVSQTVTTATPTISLARTTGSASVAFGTSLTFTATVAGGAGATQPTGSVTFKDGSTTLTCTGSGDNTLTQGAASSIATCTIATLVGGSHSITANYVPGSDPNYVAAGPSNTVSQTVGTAGPTITLARTTGSASVTYGTSLTFTATVTGTSGQTQPTGTVTFQDGSTTLTCSGANDNTLTQHGTTNSTATCSFNSLGVGTSHSITGTYVPGSDPNYTGAGPSAGIAQTVTQAAATIALATNPTSSSVDQAVTITATVTSTANAPTKPAGTISFTINGNSSTDCPNTAINTTTGKAICTTSGLVAPADVIVASYTDPNYTASSAQTTQSVSKVTAQTSVASSSPSAQVNQTVTFTATVTPPTGAGTATLPSGGVTFKRGSTVLCSSVALSGSPAAASCGYAFGAVTSGVTITATYAGDSNFNAGTAGSVNQVITPGDSAVSITASNPNPSNVGQNVTINATVAAATSGPASPKTGTVAFVDTSAIPAPVTICTEPVSGGTVTACSYPFGASGTHNITATFTSSDSNFNSSPASTPFQQVVNASTTKVTLTSSQSGALYANQPVTFSSTVSSGSGGGPIPQGTVVYRDTSATPVTTLCTVTLTAAGAVPNCIVPSSSVGPFSAGAHSVVAFFTPSNTDFNAGSSPAATVTVSQNTPAVTVALGGTPVPTSVAVDQAVNYTATIAENPAVSTTGNLSTIYPTGSVSFTFAQAGVSATSPCTAAAISQSGGTTTAVCTFSFPTAATSQPYTVTATYNGDANFLSTIGMVNQVVVQSSTVTSFSAPNPANASVNEPVTFSATVSKPAGNTGLTLPSGSITFTDTTAAPSVLLCTATVTQSTGIASCSGALRSVGTHTITAAYGGDTNFTASSGTQTETIVASTPVIKLTSSAGTVVATQTVNYFAVVSPPVTGAGAQAPTGTIVFTSSDGATNNCSPVVTSPGDGTITNSCQFAFLPTTSGNVTVTASFVSADGNFKSGTTTLMESVQNYQVAFNPMGPVSVTQGYGNNNDPFNPTTINVASTPIGGFSDSLTLSCSVQNSSNTTVANPLTCAPSTDTLSGSQVGFTVTAAAATPVDTYTVTLKATDSKFPALTQQATLLVNVIATSGTISLAPGSAATQSVIFNTAPPQGGMLASSLNTFACGNIVALATTGGGTVSSGEISCSGPATAVSISGNSTSAAITLTVNGSTSAALRRQGDGGVFAAAAFWGVPVIGLLAWAARKNAARKDLLRYLGIALLIIGMSYGIGCGGSFTRPPTVTGGPPVGSYLVQVVATDSNGVNHYAVVPLVVN